MMSCSRTSNSIRRFGHFFPNLLKSLDRTFEKSVVHPLQLIDFKGLMKMTEPRVYLLKTAKQHDAHTLYRLQLYPVLENS